MALGGITSSPSSCMHLSCSVAPTPLPAVRPQFAEHSRRCSRFALLALIPALALGLLSCRAPQDTPGATDGWSAVDSARVAEVFTRLTAQQPFMGAVAFVRDGRVVHAEGTGMANVGAGLPFTPATPADGGSLAKTLTAAALWTLAHEGRVVMDTAVTAYVPEYPHPGTTVRHLIAHANGLTPDYSQFDTLFAPDDVRTTSALLDAERRLAPRPRFTPGTRFEYSNLGFDVAALVVERVTGRSLAAVLREWFLDPFGMDSTFVRPARLRDWNGTRTLGYRWMDGAWSVVDVFDNEGFAGGSNVYFSTLDLARWAAAHARGVALPRAVRELGAPPSVIDGRPSPITGHSWYCDPTGTRCHYTGVLNAFHSFAHWDRSRGTAVAMMSNVALPPWTMVTLHRDLVAVLEGRAPDTTAAPPFVAVAGGPPGNVAGRYATPNGDTIRVRDAPDGLTLQVGTGLEFNVIPVATDAFYVPALDQVLGFTANGDSLQLHGRSALTNSVARRVP